MTSKSRSYLRIVRQAISRGQDDTRDTREEENDGINDALPTSVATSSISDVSASTALNIGHVANSTSTTDESNSLSLWSEARKAVKNDLPSDDIDCLIESCDPKSILAAAEQRWKECSDKRLQWTTSEGKIIYVSDQMSNIVEHIRGWTKPVDTFVSYDPLHSALPWGFLQVFMQVASAPGEIYARLVEGMELMSRLMFMYQSTERLYIHEAAEPREDLRISLVELYVAILKWLIAMYKYAKSDRTKRFTLSNFPTSSRNFEKLRQRVEARESRVQAILVVLGATGNEELRRMLTKQMTSKLDPWQNYDIERYKNPTQVREERLSKLLLWLQTTDTTKTFYDAVNICHPGTSTWILSRTEYKAWLESDTREIIRPNLFWINGPPGFGKTVICAKILQELNFNVPDKPKSPAAFFCNSDRQEWRSTSAILRSWIGQLAHFDDKSFKIVFELYSKNSIKSPTDGDLWIILRDIAAAVPCTLVVDGLDECSRIISRHDKYDDNRTGFLDLLITNLQHTKTRVLVSSRGHDYIRSVLQGRQEKGELSLFEHVISQVDTKEDVLGYTGWIMQQTLPDTKDDIRDELAKHSAEKSEGMFLYINLLREKTRKGNTLGDVQRAITSMPTDLETFYRNELRDILMASSRKEALAVFRWLLFATRPLALKELAEALTLTRNNESTKYPQDDLPPGFESGPLSSHWINSAVIRYCGAFVELRGSDSDHIDDKTVHFPHASMREFLVNSLRGEDLEFGLGDTEAEKDHLDELCLRYLCFDVFGYDNLQRPEFVHKYPFFFYAAISWYERSQTRNVLVQATKSGLESLLNAKSKNWKVWSEIFEELVMGKPAKDDPTSNLKDARQSALEMNSESGDKAVDADKSDAASNSWSIESPRSSDAEDDDDRDINFDGPIYYASLLGLLDLVSSLKGKGFNGTQPIGKYGTPLQAAAKSEHIDIVNYLIENGADINQTGGHYGTALGAASSTGNIELVKLLLAKNADPYLVNDEGKNSLHVACEAGHDKIAKLLLEHNRDLVNQETDEKNTPLTIAIPLGNLKLIKLLKDAGANLNTSAPLWNGTGTPISIAIACGQPTIVGYLLQHGAAAEGYNYMNDNNLMTASFMGDEESFSRLLQKGANIRHVAKSGATVLHSAVFGGRKVIVQKALDEGIDPNSKAVNGIGPLHSAAVAGQIDAVQTLLDNGADVSLVTDGGSTALSLALQYKHTGIAKILLENGANIFQTYLFGDNAFDMALDTENEVVVDEMISKGALKDLECPGSDDTQVITASRIWQCIKSEDEIAFLRDLESTIPKEPTGQVLKDSALLISVTLGGKTMIDGLLDRGANINCRTRQGRTPLMLATRRRNEPVLKLLLDRKASVKEVDNDGLGAIHIAISQGYRAKTVLDIILKAGGLFVNGENPLPPSSVVAEQLSGEWAGTVQAFNWILDAKTGIKASVDYIGASSPYPYGLPSSQSDGEDDTGHFLCIYFAYGDGQNIILRMNDTSGWLCVGQLGGNADDENGLVINGHWGIREGRWLGTYELHKQRV